MSPCTEYQGGIRYIGSTHLCRNGIGGYWWNVIFIRVDSSNDILAKIDPINLRDPIGELINMVFCCVRTLK